MPSLPAISSWGQLLLIFIGIFISIKYIYPLIRNGNGNGTGEWRGKIEQLLISNSELLHELGRSHQDILRLLEEIERRSRDQEEAIRVVLHKGGSH